MSPKPPFVQRNSGASLAGRQEHRNDTTPDDIGPYPGPPYTSNHLPLLAYDFTWNDIHLFSITDIIRSMTLTVGIF
jgi:hypothetical protein